MFRLIVRELPRELWLSSEPGAYGLTNPKKILRFLRRKFIYVENLIKGERVCSFSRIVVSLDVFISTSSVLSHCSPQQRRPHSRTNWQSGTSTIQIST